MTKVNKHKSAKMFAIAVIAVMLIAAMVTLAVGCSPKLTVKFMVDDTEVATVTDGKLPTTPTKAGYTFDGWYFDKAYSEAFTFEAAKEKKSKEPINVYSKWNIVTNTITYNLGGGENHADNPAEYNVESETIALQSPTKSGYDFLGWFGNAEFTGDAITEIAKGGTANVELFAKWNVNEYTITYNLDGGANHADNPAKYTVDSETINLQAPTKTGYAFLGWYGNAEFTGDTITEITKGSTANIALFAKFDIIVNDIIYNLDGGTNHADNPAGYTMESETINLQAPTKLGYTFLGWYGNAEFTGDAITEIANGGLVPVEIFARWQANEFTLTFNSNGGGDVESITQFVDTAITLASPTNKTGYTFGGWYTDEKLTIAFTSEVMPGENIMLYAGWNAIVNAITYNLDGGTNHVDNPEGYTIEDTITIQAPTKQCHTFLGWYDNDAFSGDDITEIAQGGTAPIELYAKWVVNKYTITFNSKGGSTVTAINQDFDSVVTKPADPIRDGYTFAGWYSDEGLTTAFVFDKMPGVDTTVYAKWDLVTYNITYNLNGGTNHAENPTTYTVDSDIALNTPTYEILNDYGTYLYDFIGWQILSKSNTAVYTSINPELGFTEDIELFAVWSSPPFEYTYNEETNSFSVTGFDAKKHTLDSYDIIPRILPIPDSDLFALVTTLSSSLRDIMNNPSKGMTFPNTLTSLESESCNMLFYEYDVLQYQGTVAEWKAIQKAADWFGYNKNAKIQCTDGVLDVNGNSVTI